MMQDDVAMSSSNPFPGKLFNHPTQAGIAGVDVYAGCKPSYSGEVVTAELFLNVLTGNKAAVAGKGVGGVDKVLGSGPDDKVFVNFIDHGGAKIVEFPNGPYLHADDLVAALKQMHSSRMYHQLVFYMEACEAGSMFEGLLPADIDVYATTASNAKESSWGTFCPPDDVVDGKTIGACLGDLYSVNWMEDSDTAAGQARTLDQQFQLVKTETNKSHVMEFGSVGTFDQTDHVSDFQASEGGSAGAATIPSEDAATALGRRSPRTSGAVDSRDIALVTAFYAYLRAESRDGASTAADALLDQIARRQRADAVFPAITRQLTSLAATAAAGARVSACEKGVYAAVEAHCGRFDDYSLKYSGGLIRFCAVHPLATVDKTIKGVCEMSS